MVPACQTAVFLDDMGTPIPRKLQPSFCRFTFAPLVHRHQFHRRPRFRADQTLGATEVTFTPETAGICEIRLTLPNWVKGLPATVKAPTYSETSL